MFLNSELEAEMELSFQMTDRSTRLFISDDRPDARQAASDRQQPLERRPDPDPEHLGSERHATTAAAE